MNVLASSTSGNRNRILTGFLRLFIFSLFAAALPLTSLQAQTVAYVTNNIEGSVSVIDTSTNAIVATIGGFSHPFCVTPSPDGTLLYVCNTDNSVVAVNTATNSVITHIPLPGALGFIGNEGAEPVIAFSPDGTRAFVVPSGGGVNSQLFVIDTASNTATAVASFGSTFLLAIAISADGSTLYLASSNGVIVVDANTFATITTIAPGHDITDLAISQPGSTLYASDNTGLLGGTSGVLVINTGSNTVTATVPLPFNPASPSFVTGIAVTPDGQHVYVEEFFFTAANSTVTVINAADNSIATTIPGNGLALTDLAITPDGSTVLATNAVLSTTVNSSVVVIDTASNTIVNAIPVGHFSATITVANLSSPFAAFTIDNLVINNNLHEQGDFTLGANSQGVDLAHQPLVLTVNNFSLMIPAGSFRQVGGNLHFVFNGTVNGLSVNFNLKAVNGSSTQFTYVVDVHGASIGGPNPATVGLKIGHNSGTTTATF